jgi:hypothetical protein
MKMTDYSSFIMGIDCSTSACKTVVWDCCGNAIAKGISSLSLITAMPDPSRHAFYSRLLEEVYRPLFPALQPYLDRLPCLTGAQESGGI